MKIETDHFLSASDLQIVAAMRAIDRETNLVPGLLLNSAILGRNRPMAPTVVHYKSLLPVILGTLDRAERLLEIHSSSVGMCIRQSIADIRAMFKSLSWRAGIIESWLDDDEGGPSPAPPDPEKPSGITPRNPVTVV